MSVLQRGIRERRTIALVTQGTTEEGTESQMENGETLSSTKTAEAEPASQAIVSKATGPRTLQGKEQSKYNAGPV